MAGSYLFTENQWERPVCEGAVGALQNLSRLFYLKNSTRLFFWCLYEMADQNVGMGETDSSMEDPSILNALIDMLKNGQGQQITMMVHEAISKVTPSCVNLVGMKDPTVPSSTYTSMPVDVSRITPTSTDVPNVGSVRILPPTSKQVSLRSLIDSQSRILRLVPDTPENIPIRQEISEQIQLWERALLESARPSSDE
ncbi:hypothetical protein SUGI_0700370 [Cryptomeria japonica]|nr:hypothetical protein SUGI_0700370 [Cryptomeria japonica]